ncbi:MAG: phage terminase large subunit, partial [Halobacteriales archaeon]|nr:phage terminase large subunit [Halobacteriales archaeon]
NAEEWNPGETGMIVAPTTPHLKNVILPEMRKWGLLDHVRYEGKGSEEPGLHFPSGARVILESADNDRKIERLRGPSISWFWIDEAGHQPFKVWKILAGRLRTGNYRNGFITTTPAGKNWVYKRFYTHETEEGITVEGPPDDVNLVYGVPSTANPHLPDDYADITDEYTGHEHEQEVMGLFVRPEGLVYQEFDPSSHVVSGTPENPGRTWYGVDWGSRNPAAILAIVETRTDELWVTEEFYETRLTTMDLADVALEMVSRWGPGTFYCDPAEPDRIETFRREGLDAIPAENDIAPGISTVRTELERLRVRDTCQNTINEFGSYRYPDENEREENEDETPVDANNHALDALRYALHTPDLAVHNIGVDSGDLYE